jgi:hypothetical protein
VAGERVTEARPAESRRYWLYFQIDAIHQTKIKMRKTLQLFLRAHFLLVIVIFVILPYHADSQTNTASATRDTMNIGYAVYTKGATAGTLHAIWNYANVWSGKGKATGVSRGGFTGNYHIKYYYENGAFSDEYDLVIEKAGKFYNLSWMIDGKLSARGVGTVVDDRLVAGWRRVAD